MNVVKGSAEFSKIGKLCLRRNASVQNNNSNSKINEEQHNTKSNRNNV